jgi:hypothetical protein
MPAINRTSNPTKVISIDRSALAIRVSAGKRATDPKCFSIDRFSIEKAGVLGSLKVGCLAMAGQTAQYFDLGTAAKLDTTQQVLTELATDAAVRFRVMFYEPHDSKIVAAADNIKPIDEDGSSHSLVSIQPGKLDGPMWKLELSDVTSENQPVVHVEEQLFSSAKTAVSSAAFMSLVLPEVLRQIATKIVHTADEADLESSWIGKWVEYFAKINPNPLEELETESEKSDWVDDSTRMFCRKGAMPSLLASFLNEPKV